MTLLDEVIAKTEALGLDADPYMPRPRGERLYAESRAGRLVRQLEDHFNIHPFRRGGPLGERFRRLP